MFLVPARVELALLDCDGSSRAHAASLWDCMRRPGSDILSRASSFQGFAGDPS